MNRRLLPLTPVQGNGAVAPSPAVVDALHSLPLRTVGDIRAAFPAIPLEHLHTDGHFRNLRVLTTSTCAMRCGYPGEDTMWCHNEGLSRNRMSDADLSAMRQTVARFRDTHGVTRVTLAGLEPRLNDDLLSFVAGMRADGIDTVSLVSHGLHLKPWLSRLQAAGLSDLVLSVQAFARTPYADIMGRDAFANALAVIDTAENLKLPVAVNRVLLKGYHEDIPGFLDWIADRRLRVRLYDVMWMPGQADQWLRNHISWQHITHLWADRTERITVWTYGLPGRINVVWWLKGGASIETNVNYPKTQHTAEVCRTCTARNACVDGWMGCGIRITPDLKASGCVLRPDLAMPLREPGGGYVEVSRINSYISGRTTDEEHRPCC